MAPVKPCARLWQVQITGFAHKKIARLNHHYLLLSATFARHKTGGYALRKNSKQGCSSGNALATIMDCESAKAVLDPSATAVKSEHDSDVPKGCFRSYHEWFFNTATGNPISSAESVCRTETGSSKWICAYVHTNKLAHTHSICSGCHL